MRWTLVLLAFWSVTALAADVTGNWKSVVETPTGSDERTFVFKQVGTALTGETSSAAVGKSVIESGAVTGDNVIFSITVKIPGNDLKIHYKGKLSGDSIKFVVDIPSIQQKTELVAKRVS